MGNSNNTNNYSSKRILKNTLFLYVRQIVTLIVSLYTSRVILDILGVDDYGIYNVIAGFIVLLSLINNSMTSATQRFISYELGHGDKQQVSRTFSMSMTAHILVCVLVLVLGETIGLWYVYNGLVVPEDRAFAAHWVYQISLLSVFVTIIRSPYQASTIAYEKMDAFSIISILEVVLKLVIVYLLALFSYDKLILYAILLLLSNLLITGVYKIYCSHKFDTCNYSYFMEASYFKKLLSFLGWNVLGASSTMGTQQAGSLIINRYVGVAINAAYGIANQVSSAVSSFVTNFQMAFTPQIVKLYATGERTTMFTLMFRSSVLSFYLLFFIVTPILLNIDYVLSLWLKEVPPYTGVFCIWVFGCSFIDSLQAPLSIAINASGTIKKYYIWQSSLWLLTIPAIILCFHFEMSLAWVVIVRFIVGIICSIVRTIQAQSITGMPISQYLKSVILRVLMVVLICIPLYIKMNEFLHVDSIIKLFLFYCLSFIISGAVVLFLGISNKDRALVFSYVRRLIYKNKQ